MSAAWGCCLMQNKPTTLSLDLMDPPIPPILNFLQPSRPKPSALDSPRREARIQTRGCVSTHPTQLGDTLSPPHWESCQPLKSIVSPSQCAPSLPPASCTTVELVPAQKSWSTSAARRTT
ncbi:uncharacterized protein VP01_799g1 [Puccinia sorghi]|uniref:Uncharacterized protein n=1 Tax=Puccinia sorghi TaxID=27349 RepID=A0A0L6UAL2_9BASI|nr:uncharacterized protein VP01_799g1 [Puccinia sorghi]